MTDATLAAPSLSEPSLRNSTPLWWALLLLVAIEATAMGLLLAGALFLRGDDDVWPSAVVSHSGWWLAAIDASLLFASYVPSVLSVRAARRERVRAMRAWLSLATLMGIGVVVLRFLELPPVGVRWDTDAYGSIYGLTFGLHTAHVLAAAVDNVLLLACLFLARGNGIPFGEVEATTLLWLCCVLEWVPGFVILYVEPSFPLR